MVGGTCGFDESSDFLLAQNHRQPLRPFRIDKIDLAVGSSKHFAEKEAERSDPPDDRFNGEMAIVQQVQLILSQMFLSKLIRTFLEVGGKILHRKQVGADGFWRIVSTLEFFQHSLA